MKLGKWTDGKVEIMHILLFCSSTINFGCYVNLKFVPLTYNGRNCGSYDNLKTARYFLMKLNKWIDGKMEIMHILSFCLSDQNFGCYGNFKFPLACNGKKWILQ